MKKRLFLILILVNVMTFAFSQIKAPAKYDSSVKINYIRTWEPVKPYSIDTDLIKPVRSIQEVRQITDYYDGLGRPLQSVIRSGSMVTGDTSRDLINPLVYDSFGREVYKYLPFAANSANGNTSLRDGRFKLNPFQQDSVFINGLFSEEHNFIYGQVVMEPSPISRVLESYAPGDNWVGSQNVPGKDDRHGIITDYQTNKSTDSVRIWTVRDTTKGFATYLNIGTYTKGQLYKVVTRDEDKRQVILFTDKFGNEILKKVQLTADADTGQGENHTGWLCTYYIYDSLNNLRCIIQPEGVKILAGNGWSLNSTLLFEQCFRFEYDYRNRLRTKKMPGAWEVYLIYDARDRICMVQDSVQRGSGKWLYTHYDSLNRAIIRGFYSDSYSREQHEANAAVYVNYPNFSMSGASHDTLTQTFYDDYSWRSSEGNPLSSTRNSTYDSYLLTNSNSSFPYPQDATIQSIRTRGLITGTKAKVLGTSNSYLYTVKFVDDKKRLIQSQASNYAGGVDVNSMQYSWTGELLLDINKQNISGSNAQTNIIITKNTYDTLFRLLKTEKKISTTRVNSGTMPSNWTVINALEYNATGHIKKKELGNQPIESLNYEYNIRDWPLGYNRGYVKDTTSTSNWFGIDLSYNHSEYTINSTAHDYSSSGYGGNIYGTLWRSAGDGYVRRYSFTYDKANRLTSADFTQLNSNSFSKAAGIDFTSSGLTYDANGNILTSIQKGWKIGGSVTIDSLFYGYNTNSNHLNSVNDKANDSLSYLGDFKEYVNNSSQDYTYDANGNIISDANKKITNIIYNHLNLPSEIDIQYNLNPPYSSRKVSYIYDANGNKLEKIVNEVRGTNNNSTNTIKYLNGTEYETVTTNSGGSPDPGDHTDVLQFIPTEEGTAGFNKDSTELVYNYMLRDHLGNVRMILTTEKDTAYYPAATMETGNATTENTYYANIEETRYPKPSGYTDNSTSPNNYVAYVIADHDSTTVGPSMVLKVMAGDKFNVKVSSWWSSVKEPDNTVDPLPILLAQAEGNIGNFTGSHGGPTGSQLTSSGVLLNGITNFLNGQSYDDTRPKAYINWILFDERFNYVASSSGYEQTGSDNHFYTHEFDNMPIEKNGYLYVFVSNATPNIPVFFDNLQVTHIKGSLVEENHYYPFGLTMAGISSKALNIEPANRSKFNEGTELTSDFGISLYETKWRLLDPQIGRFLQSDMIAPMSANNSPYGFAASNPINLNDILGLLQDTITLPTANTHPAHITHELGEGMKNYLLILHGQTPINNAYPDEMAKWMVRSILNPGWEHQPGLPPNLELSDEEFLDQLKEKNMELMAAVTLASLVGIPELALEELLAEGLTAEEFIAAVAEEEGVYDITLTGGRYIGQSKNILKRLLQHFKKGGKLTRFGEIEKQVTYAMEGSSKLEREVYEQYLVNKVGIKNLINARNPMGGRTELYKSMVDLVIRRYGLPR